jgi:hypothetical protein
LDEKWNPKFTIIVAQKKKNQDAGTINPEDLKKIRQ